MTTNTPTYEERLREEFKKKYFLGNEALTDEVSEWLIQKVREEKEASRLEGKTEERMETIKWIKENDDLNIENYQISYDQNVDITEIPEGLIAEMTGMKKGVNFGKDIILGFLTQPTNDNQ